MPRDLVIRHAGPAIRSSVRIAGGGLDRLGAFVKRLARPSRAVVVSDLTVSALYGRRALASLTRSGIAAALVTIPNGERTKSPRHLERLWRTFGELDLDRDGVVVALGGGVVGDLAGLAAATWQRGVAWCGVPTTVVAQVDASIGGKTAIDLPGGKNVVGAFHQPIGVLVDPRVLGTLPPRQRRAGLAEVVKTAMVADAATFAWIERDAEALAAGRPAALATAVERALRAKARIVARDPFDRDGVRSALNFGHTLGHAIESACGYRGVLHGEAVAIGMRAAARLSSACVRLPASARERLDAVLDRLGLPRHMPDLELATLMRAMGQDKKRQGGAVRWVLTPRIGHASVPRLIPRRLVRAALLEAGARA